MRGINPLRVVSLQVMRPGLLVFVLLAISSSTLTSTLTSTSTSSSSGFKLRATG